MINARVPYGAWLRDAHSGTAAFFLAERLSLGGLELRVAAKPPPVGRAVRVQLVVENEQTVLTVEAEVVRRRSQRFAVRFLNLGREDREFLAALVGEVAPAC